MDTEDCWSIPLTDVSKSFEPSQDDLLEKQTQRLHMIYGYDDAAIHRFGWSPIHVWQFKNLAPAIPNAYVVMTYFFEKPDSEEIDHVKVFWERCSMRRTITLSMCETATCQI